MHSLDGWPWVESGGWAMWGGGGGAAQQPRRGTGRSGGAGLKKAEPGVWWAEWCCFFSFSLPFSSAPACFLGEDAAIC